MTDNVILFPSKKRIIPQQTAEEIERSSKQFKSSKIEEISLDITDLILSELNEAGIDISTITETQLKDIGLLIESTKSLVSRFYSQPHFLNALADELFTETEEGVFLAAGLVVNVEKIEKNNGNNRS